MRAWLQPWCCCSCSVCSVDENSRCVLPMLSVHLHCIQPGCRGDKCFGLISTSPAMTKRVYLAYLLNSLAAAKFRRDHPDMLDKDHYCEAGCEIRSGLQAASVLCAQAGNGSGSVPSWRRCCARARTGGRHSFLPGHAAAQRQLPEDQGRGRVQRISCWGAFAGAAPGLGTHLCQ